MSVRLVFLELADRGVRFSTDITSAQGDSRDTSLHVDTQESSTWKYVLAQGTLATDLGRVELADVQVARQHDAARLSETAPRTVGRQHVALQNFSGHAPRRAVRTLLDQTFRWDTLGWLLDTWNWRLDSVRWLDGVRSLLFQSRLLWFLGFWIVLGQPFPETLVVYEE